MKIGNKVLWRSGYVEYPPVNIFNKIMFRKVN